jgi:hypothetical protein
LGPAAGLVKGLVLGLGLMTMALTKTILAADPNDHNHKLIFTFLLIYFWFLVFGLKMSRSSLLPIPTEG